MSLTLPRALLLLDAGAVLAQLLSALEAETQAMVAIDASPLQQLDSSAIAVLLQCRREAHRQQREIRLVGAPQKLIRLMQLYGVSELLPQQA